METKPKETDDISQRHQRFPREMTSKACFKRRATNVPNSIDEIKFDFSTAVARRLKPSRATAV